jgi:hypothetical protein
MFFAANLSKQNLKFMNTQKYQIYLIFIIFVISPFSCSMSRTIVYQFITKFALKCWEWINFFNVILITIFQFEGKIWINNDETKKCGKHSMSSRFSVSCSFKFQSSLPIMVIYICFIGWFVQSSFTLLFRKYRITCMSR